MRPPPVDGSLNPSLLHAFMQALLDLAPALGFMRFGFFSGIHSAYPPELVQSVTSLVHCNRTPPTKHAPGQCVCSE